CDREEPGPEVAFVAREPLPAPAGAEPHLGRQVVDVVRCVAGAQEPQERGMVGAPKFTRRALLAVLHSSERLSKWPIAHCTTQFKGTGELYRVIEGAAAALGAVAF